MYLPLGKFSPDIKIGLVSASRNCFPRKLADERTNRLIAEIKKLGIKVFIPKGECRIIETRAHARDAARQMQDAGCSGAVLYLGNFSPEIEDAVFANAFPGKVMVMAAEEEKASGLMEKRGDALCGLLSAALAMRKRGLKQKVHIPENPLVSAQTGASEIKHFESVLKVTEGISNAIIGLFGPRPRDFETVNYNTASLSSIGVEVEELGHFDLAASADKFKKTNLSTIVKSMAAEVGNAFGDEFMLRLAAYEKSLLKFREDLKLSGAATQCWPEQEGRLGHVPCFINARLAAKGFPVACENDAYSLVAELMGQYGSDGDVTILDINHSIPRDLGKAIKDIDPSDLLGMFHCGNTNTKRLKNPEMKYQVIMKRLMEPDTKPDITRGTIEGAIAASPITVIQVHGSGDSLCAYIAEGEFLDMDPRTFGAASTAHIPGFMRFYRNVLLGRFHHHAAVAFAHCGAVVYDALKMLGVKEIFTPNPASLPYPGENIFRSSMVKK